MKGLIAALAMLITVGFAVVCALVELLIKLAPLLVLAAGIWIAIKVWRTWRRKRRDSRGHHETPWEWQYPAQGPNSSAEFQPIERPAVASPAPTSPAPASAGSAALPPVIAHHHRSFVVRGDESGLLTDREDGYLYVSAHELPRVPRAAATHQHRPNVGARRTSSRREVRRRP